MFSDCARCSSYPNDVANCRLVPDLRDPACCMVPECDDLPVNVTGQVGTVTGVAKPPTPATVLGSTASTRGAYFFFCLSVFWFLGSCTKIAIH